MSKEFDRHKCPENNWDDTCDYSEIIYRTDCLDYGTKEGWYIEMEEEQRARIKYCPFCGIKLLENI